MRTYCSTICPQSTCAELTELSKRERKSNTVSRINISPSVVIEVSPYRYISVQLRSRRPNSLLVNQSERSVAIFSINTLDQFSVSLLPIKSSFTDEYVRHQTVKTK